MSRTLAAVLFGLLAFASPAVFALHDNYVFNSEAEANASSIWTGEHQGGLPALGYWGWYFIRTDGSLGGGMPVEGVLSAGRAKVVEMSNAWLVEMRRILAASGDTVSVPSCPSPTRELECTKSPLTRIYEPGTTTVIDAYPYYCSGQYYAICTLYSYGSLATQGNQVGRLTG